MDENSLGGGHLDGLVVRIPKRLVRGFCKASAFHSKPRFTRAPLLIMTAACTRLTEDIAIPLFHSIRRMQYQGRCHRNSPARTASPRRPRQTTPEDDHAGTPTPRSLMDILERLKAGRLAVLRETSAVLLSTCHILLATAHAVLLMTFPMSRLSAIRQPWTGTSGGRPVFEAHR
jgi:hypothetical protein